MLSLDLCKRKKGGATLLCLGAHCDDIEIGCGGTLLKLLDQNRGLTVHWIVLSSDALRATEAQESAEAFLARAASKNIVIKDFRNSFFPFVGDEIKEYFEHLKATVSPDVIFTHQGNDLHQDHSLISRVTWNTFRNHLILEYEIPKYDGDFGSPNAFYCLDEPAAQRKIDLILKCFRSQQDRQWFDPETFLAVLRLRGIECNSPSRYAEAFYCRKIVIG